MNTSPSEISDTSSLSDGATRSLRATLDQRIVALIAADEVAVTPYPAVVLRLNEVLGRPEHATSDLMEVLQTDAALTATILRHANAAGYGGGIVISDLRAALTRLGEKELLQVVLAAELSGVVCTPAALAPLRFAVWRDALIGAHLAQSIARSRDLDPGEAFLAGLLHNFGQVVAIACIETIIETEKDLAPMPASFWWELIEDYHLELGLVTATTWKLPEVFRDVIAHHHAPPPAASPLVGLMPVVDGITEALHATTRLDAIDFSTWFSDEGERLLVAEVCGQLPAMVAALGADDPSAGVAGAASETCWVEAPDAVEGSSVDFVVDYLSDRDPAVWRAVSMTEHSLRVRSDRLINENALIRVALTWGPDRFEVWTNVSTVSIDTEESWLLDLVPFALGRDEGERWAQWFGRLSLPQEERELAQWKDIIQRASEGMREEIAVLSASPTKAQLAKAKVIAEEASETSQSLPEAIASIPEIVQAKAPLAEVLASLREAIADAEAGFAKGRGAQRTRKAAPGRHRSRQATSSGSGRPQGRLRLLVISSILAVVFMGRIVMLVGESGASSDPSAVPPVIVAGAGQTTLATAGPRLDRDLRAGKPVIFGVTLARQGSSLRATVDAVDDEVEDPAITYVWFQDGRKLHESSRSIVIQTGRAYQVEVTASDGEHTSSAIKSAIFKTR